MSASHPIIAVTGSSGAGTSTAKHAFDDIFRRGNIKPVIVEGDSFHRYDRQEMPSQIAKAEEQGTALTHFGPEANHLDRLEILFQTYSETGKGKSRKYIHDDAKPSDLKSLREHSQVGRKSVAIATYFSMKVFMEVLSQSRLM